MPMQQLMRVSREKRDLEWLMESLLTAIQLEIGPSFVFRR